MPILRRYRPLRRSDVEAKAKQYGLNMRLQKDRLIAAEKVQAGLAQTNPKNTVVQRGRKAESASGGLAGAFSRRKETRTFAANHLLAALAHSMHDAPDHTAQEEARTVAGTPLKNVI